jgi:hypothetical protein
MRYLLGGAAVALTLAGCGADDSTANGGTDASPQECVGADGVPCMSIAGGLLANFDCAPATPAPGTPQPIEVRLRSRSVESSSPGTALALELFHDNAITDTCTGQCLALTADDLGNAMVDLSPGFFAYRIPSTGNASDDVVTSTGYRVLRSTDAWKNVAYTTHGDIEAFTAAGGKSRVEGSGALDGGIFDCDDQPVAGAIVRIYAEGQEVSTGAGAADPVITYSNGLIPDPHATATDPMGRYAAGNLPVTGTGRIRVEVHGVRAAGGPRELVACEEGRVFSNGYMSRPMRPLRTDYAPDSGCSR